MGRNVHSYIPTKARDFFGFGLPFVFLKAATEDRNSNDTREWGVDEYQLSGRPNGFANGDNQ